MMNAAEETQIPRTSALQSDEDNTLPEAAVDPAVGTDEIDAEDDDELEDDEVEGDEDDEEDLDDEDEEAEVDDDEDAEDAVPTSVAR